MKKKLLFLLLAFCSALALKFSSGVSGFGSAKAHAAKPTPLMTKDLPDVLGKEGMIETVDFAPGEVSHPHRHNADVFAYVLEGSIITQLKGGTPQTVSAPEIMFLEDGKGNGSR